MKFEDDNLNYLLRRGGKRRGPSGKISAEMPAREVEVIEPRRLVERPPDYRVPSRIRKLSQYPFAKQISFFSIMEIASQVGFITEVPDEVKISLDRFLRRQDHLRPRKDMGELVLPHDLRDRIAGKFERTPPSDELAAVFVQFSESSRRVEEDKDIGALVSFLRDGKQDNHSIEDLVAIFGDPNRLLSCFVQRNMPSALRDSVLGISKLRRFTSYLDRQLSELSDQKILARKLWHYHHHWLSNGRIQFDALLTKVGRELARWTEPEPNRPPSQFPPSLLDPNVPPGTGEKNPLTDSISSVKRLLAGDYFK